MKPVYFKPIMHGLIATTLATSHIWSMETTATTTTNPQGQDLTKPIQQPFAIMISGKSLNSNDTYADLINLHLTTVPAEIGRLSALKELYLSFNKLTTVPAEIGHLSALKELDLTRNLLTTVPAEIGHLSALKELSLSFNKLTTVPAEIGNLSAMQRLVLNGNQLTTVPAEIGHLSALKDLSLSFNQLTTVPAMIGNLSALNELELSGNPLAGSESKWAKRLQGAELNELRLYCIKKDLEIKTMMVLLANQHDNGSYLANFPSELVQLICRMHIHNRMG